MQSQFRAFIRRFPTPYVALALPLLILTTQAILARTYIYCAWQVTYEDRLIEWLAVIALLAGAGFAVINARHSARNRALLFALFYAGFALAAIAAAGEEISWGQRLLGIETPEWVSESSSQDETNLHNLLEGLTDLRTDRVLLVVALVYGALIPLVTAKGRIPVPPLFLIPGFLIGAFLMTHPFDYFNSDLEMGELAISACLALFMLAELQKAHAVELRLRPRRGAISAGIALALAPLIVLGMTATCRATWCGQQEADPPVIAWIEANVTPEQGVLLAHDPDIYQRLFMQCALDGPNVLRPMYPGISHNLQLENTAQIAQIMDELTSRYDHIVAFYEPGVESAYDPDGLVETRLRAEAFEAGTTDFGHVRVVEYGMLRAPETRALDATFDGRIELNSVTYDSGPLSGGEILPVALEWQATEPLEQDYTVGVYLLDESGRLAAQHDSPPRSGTAPTSTWDTGASITDHHGLRLPDDTPAGTYRLYTTLYDADGRLPATLEGVDAPDSLVLLATVAVE